MKIAYLDTASGIAGDMMLAALVDAGADGKLIESKIRSLGLPEVELVFSQTRRCGFRAVQLDVRHPPEHVHRSYRDIVSLIEAGQLQPSEKELSLRIFRSLGQAEAKVHGMPIESVHFHEIGSVDSIADIVGVAIGLAELQIQRIVSAPPATGTGAIRIAHGTVSVPAPATAELLTGVPLRSSNVLAELITPTGAAILASLCDQYGPMPNMTLEAIGYGAGHLDLPDQPNFLRLFVGRSWDTNCDPGGLLATAKMVNSDSHLPGGEHWSGCDHRLYHHHGHDHPQN